MPGKLFDIKRYFKRNGKTQTPPAGQVAGGQAQPPEEVVQKRTVVSQATTGQTAQAKTPPAEPYSGIGYPPGGGEPYSGIGYPPESPSPSVSAQTVTKTKTVTETTKTGPQPPVQPGEGQAPPQPPTRPPSGEPTPRPPTPAPVSKSAIDATKRAGMDVLTRLTQRSNQAILQGVQKAKDCKVRYIDTEHILWGLLTDSGIYQLLSNLGVVPKVVQDELEKNFKKGKFTGQPQFSPRVKRVLELAFSAARALGFEFISPEHILLAIAQEGEGLGAQTLAKFNITVEALNKKIVGKKEVEKEAKKGASALEQYCQDLTQAAREGRLDPVVARAAEIERVIHILSRRTKNNPCLIGDAGVGKTAIVEGLAQRIAAGDVPEPMVNKRILQLDLMSLIAGARHRGEFEERLKTLIREIKAASGQIIVFIDEIQNLVGAGAGEGAMDASNILKPSLARGELQAVGATTVTEYRKYIEKDPALERRFQPVLVAEPTVDQAIEMLRALRDKYEAFHKVSISDEAIEAAVRLSRRYIGDRFLPDKAVDLIDEAASAVRLPAISLPEEIKSLKEKQTRLEAERREAEKLGDQVRMASLDRELEGLRKKLEEATAAYEHKKSTTTNVVTPEFIAEIVSRWTRIPISKLTEKESEKLLRLEEEIHSRIVDQEAAVASVAEAVRRGRAGLTSGKRPIGSFIFMGPTGVGKTETAKALAEILFGSEDMMVRLDMSEFMEKHEVAKLIGAPPGYVGYEEGGQLTEAVRLHPYSVVLLDEIEKAHPDVFNILIQLLDDGRLTDNKGRTVSFKNTIVICTSNIGTGLIQREMLQEAGLIEKISALDTYVTSPVGGEMITLKERFWLKSPPKGKKAKKVNNWTTGLLEEFFAGHVVVNAEPGKPEQRLPKKGFNAHVIMPSGQELILAGGRYWQRTSQVSREWTTGTLGDLFAEQVVTNAALDDPLDQLPTARIDTIAVSPDEVEVVTLDGRFWMRENLTTKEWTVGSLKDYFADQIVSAQGKEAEESKGQKTQTAKEGKGEAKKWHCLSCDFEFEAKEKSPCPSCQSENVEESKEKIKEGEKAQRLEPTTDPDLQLPTEKLDVHLFKPDGTELVILGNHYWKRESRESNQWVTGTLGEVFAGQKVTNADPNDPTQQLPIGQEVKKAEEEKEAAEEKRFAEMAEKLVEELRKFFRPELLNRFDEIIVFRPLTRRHMLEIVELQLKQTAKLLEEQNIGFRVTRAARDELARLGYDPLYGARPLRRTIQRVIENPVSSAIIKGEIKPADLIEVDFDGNNFVFTPKRPLKPAPPKLEAIRWKCLDCGAEFEAEAGLCPECNSQNVEKWVEEGRVSKWRCLDCGFEFEAKEKGACPSCQSENIKTREAEAGEAKEEEVTPEEAQKRVDELARKVSQEETEKSPEPAPQSQPGREQVTPVMEIAQAYGEDEAAKLAAKISGTPPTPSVPSGKAEPPSPPPATPDDTSKETPKSS